MAEGDEGNYDDKASFNDALGQIQRLNELTKRLIDSKVNPFAIDMQFGVLNYQVRISSIESLWAEVRPKCNNYEIKFIEAIQQVCRETLKKYPLIIHNENKVIYIEHNYAPIDFVFRKLEEEITVLKDKYGLGNPSKQVESGL